MAAAPAKKVLLGITGSIAAYKSAILARLLIKAGYKVRCIMTESAKVFISPLTLATLTKNKVYSDIYTEEGWTNHVEMGMWADVMLVAPLTANSLGKMANGLADNMLTATYLSAKCPCFLAPAMDLDMWHHPSTQQNIRTLKHFGNTVIPVGYGELASGLVGDGRMAEPEDILTILDHHFNSAMDLKGKKVLVTGGPTYEHLDPVRFLGNHSSGKMGIALAEAALERGATVTLITGPISVEVPAGITTLRVVSSDDMYKASLKHFHESDIAIWAAAVADYKPKTVSSEKIKKSDDGLQLELERTIDIAGTLGASKKSGQLLVGFALETYDEVGNALKKMEKKNLDLIVLNSLRDAGAGFGHDTNKITLLSKSGFRKKFDLKLKQEVAKDIINEIISLLKNA
ncbi:MAG: bifunctional phosphopantothenoylcysteine decarboxylase/phosphopantothenate--cysteine ligase CoaBC [Saprospiraceae bacterium]|nr:bifunctional phosphopantothenoylcysteine decarboxylase/phosphopantothenate--cysteine ligase CoaBC [Saprospiraceae bacterium]